MNYHRIYEAFIQDRRAKEAGLTGYTERHHIVPRSLGGGNDPENLINLTAEDHFFAHLLLAKMHGGRLSSAVQLLLDSCNARWRMRFHSRARYAFAKKLTARLLAASMSGNANHLHNATVFRWKNYRTGAVEAATLMEMHAKYGASRGSWTQVANGQRPSIKGWLLEEKATSHTNSEKGQVFTFVNRDGRKFCGTQSEFIRHTGINAASASRVVRSGSVTLCGWRREGVLDRVANQPKDGSRGAALGKGRVYHLVHRDGMRFVGTAEDFRVLMNMPVSVSMSVRLSGLRRGSMPTLYGWSFEKAEQANAR